MKVYNFIKKKKETLNTLLRICKYITDMERKSRWKVYGTNLTLSRGNSPPKVSDWLRREFVREATKRSDIYLGNL